MKAQLAESLNITEPSVFDFVDARSFVISRISYLQQSQLGFSLRKFSKEIGMSGSGHIHNVMSGRILLSEKVAQKLSQGFALSKVEAKAFFNLVLLDSLPVGSVKDDLKQKILDERLQRKKTKLKEEQYAYFTHWFYPVIREMVGLADFKMDPQWIASRLAGQVTALEVAQALKTLFSLGLIRSEGSAVVQSEPVVETEDVTDVSALIPQFHRTMMNKAQEAQDLVAASLREITGMTITLGDEDLDQLKQEVIEFRRSVFKKYGQAKPTHNRVYQINLQMFPLTK
jgi:uncharacterized protein (TIGR02147 family)